MAVTPKKTYQFPRNQCIACNGIIHDRNHSLLLFGSSREAEKTRLNFENLTRITLKTLTIRTRRSVRVSNWFQTFMCYFKGSSRRKIEPFKKGNKL